MVLRICEKFGWNTTAVLLYRRTDSNYKFTHHYIGDALAALNMDNKKGALNRERKFHLKNLVQIKIDDCQQWTDLHSKDDYDKITDTLRKGGASAWQFGSEATKSDELEDKPKIIKIDWNCVRKKLIANGRIIITLLDETTLKQMLKEFFVQIDSNSKNFFEMGEFVFLVVDPYRSTSYESS